MAEITATKEYYERLKARYATAVAEGEERFVFDGQDFATDYVKYLLEYLATQFEA